VGGGGGGGQLVSSQWMYERGKAATEHKKEEGDLKDVYRSRESEAS